MTTYLVPLVLIGGLTGTGVYLLLERNLTRMLLGLLLIGNAVNLLILVMGGDSGNPPVRGRTATVRREPPTHWRRAWSSPRSSSPWVSPRSCWR